MGNAAYVLDRRVMCMHWQVAAPFCINITAVTLNVWCKTKIWLSIDAYLLEEQSCQISPRSDLKRRSLIYRLLFELTQEQEEQDEQRYEISS